MISKEDEKKLEAWHWPYAGRGELACPHGVGHGGIHGCDGCCSHPGFDKYYEKRKQEGFKLKR